MAVRCVGNARSLPKNVGESAEKVTRKKLTEAELHGQQRKGIRNTRQDEASCSAGLQTAEKHVPVEVGELLGH